MTRIIPLSTAFAFAFALPAAAAAQSTRDSSCPPGSWFCAEAPQQQAAPAGQPVKALEPLPDPDEAPEAPAPPPPPKRRHPRPPPPVVVYQPPPGPPPPPPPLMPPDEPPPPYPFPPPARPQRYPGHEWGLNLHLEGASFGHGTGQQAGMGGAGVGLRFKPTRYFGIETDLDFLGGNDYQGNSRAETAFSINGLVFLNPRSPAQIYLLAGFGWSGAHVTCDESVTACLGNTNLDTHYSYFGGQLGAGLEIRLGRSFALNADVRGFIRARTDDKAQSQPEFVDQYGRTTNTSGGALFTGGMTIYF